MAQVKVYGLKGKLSEVQKDLSGMIHEALVEALALPAEKCFQRFFHLERSDFIYPESRSEGYTIIEIMLFEGRSLASKKRLMQLLFSKAEVLGFAAQDLEICLFESPRHNWGIRGQNAAELGLNYPIDL